MKDGKIRIGLIGAGNICQSAHIPSYLEQSDAELYAVCDLKAERAEEVRQRYGMKVADASTTYCQSELDAVSMRGTTRTRTRSYGRRAPSTTVQPMCMNPAEALEMKKEKDRSSQGDVHDGLCAALTAMRVAVGRRPKQASGACVLRAGCCCAAAYRSAGSPIFRSPAAGGHRYRGYLGSDLVSDGTRIGQRVGVRPSRDRGL